MKTRFIILLSALILVLGCVSEESTYDSATLSNETSTSDVVGPNCPPDCNVVLFTVDALRADHLGVYGHYRNTSPNIDKFSEQSMVFRNSIAQAPWTLPSYMSMLTGLYASQHGVLDAESSVLGNETITLADILHGQGYKTAAFTGGAWVSEKHNYHTFDVFDESGGLTGNNFDEMIGWLNSNSEERFFLLWHDFTVHCPYTPSEEFDVFAEKSFPGVLSYCPDEFQSQLKGDVVNCRRCKRYFDQVMDNMTESDFEYVKKKYDGGILWADDRFARFLETLDEKGIRDETIIIFVSDHGQSFADRENRGRVGHTILYEEVLRVPLILNIPGQKESAEVQEIVELIDLMPTVLGLLEMDVPEGIEGKNLLENHREYDSHAYSENFRKYTAYSLRNDNLKIIYYEDEDLFEFYDLDEDPHERNDLSGQNTTQEDQLRELLMSKIPIKISLTQEAQIDEEAIEELKALGYVT
ncbi:sulfatase [Candidatus Altiarchaeota archaeon]